MSFAATGLLETSPQLVDAFTRLTAAGETLDTFTVYSDCEAGELTVSLTISGWEMTFSKNAPNDGMGAFDWTKLIETFLPIILAIIEAIINKKKVVTDRV